MTIRERNILFLVLAILASCGVVTFISPSPAEPGVPAEPDARTDPESTLVPTAASTRVPTRTPAPSHTPPSAPTSTAAPTTAPTNTPLPAATPTMAASGSLPAGTPVAAAPLAMDWVLVQKGCVSDAQWMVEVWLTAEGGTGEYTYFRDAERLHGPARENGFAYRLHAGTGSAAEGTFIVESGAQRVRSAFWIERLDCGSTALPLTPDDSPTSMAAVSPLLPPTSSP